MTSPTPRKLVPPGTKNTDNSYCFVLLHNYSVHLQYKTFFKFVSLEITVYLLDFV